MPHCFWLHTLQALMFLDIFLILFPLSPFFKVMSLSGRHNLQSRPRPQPIRPAGTETRQASWCQLRAWEKQNMQYLSTLSTPYCLRRLVSFQIWWYNISIDGICWNHFIDAKKSRAPPFCFPARFRSRPILEFHHLSVSFSNRPLVYLMYPMQHT